MAAPVLMVVGTASSVGKSILVTALCRAFAQEGVRVAPFKAQNMSNNADVTPDGLEIGRAQAEQAAAAGLLADVDMNPVLLKPQGDRTSQIVLDGRPAGVLTSADFDRRAQFWPFVEGALGRLRAKYDLVIAEGAGAAIEPNLYATDIVNMRVARHAHAVTLLVGDIDRGGVFAHFVGTLALMPPEDRALVRGLIINRFRGDETLLAPAIADVEARTGVPVLGVIPWLDEIDIAEEDAASLAGALERPARADVVDLPPSVEVAVIRLPRIANFDDFDPLAREPGVRLRYVQRAEDLAGAQLIVLPGTKSTIADLEWLRARGLDAAIHQRLAAGAHILGICGGLQMLGERITDDEGVEAAAGASVEGLGLLALRTSFVAEKATRRVAGHVATSRGTWAKARGLAVSGYEIHMGRSEGAAEPFLTLDGHPDGAVSADGLVGGTYLHGLLHNDGFRRTLLRSLGWVGDVEESSAARRERAFDRLAGVVRAHLDLDRVRGWLELPAR